MASKQREVVEAKLDALRRIASPLLLMLLLSLATSTAYSPSRAIFSSFTRRSPCLFVSLQGDLDSMTVKELRRVLKENNLDGRGILSKLKLKKDLVNYLKENLPSVTNASQRQKSDVINGKIHDATCITLSSGSVSPRSVRPRKMPPLQPPANKEAMYNFVYEIYPPLLLANCSGLGDEDIRQSHHPMLRNMTLSDMDIITVGTASCSPGITRGVSCTALRLHWQRRYFPSQGSASNVQQTNFVGGTWLFDVGECTQLQVQRTNRIRPGKINKIFLTHAHGDHTFGLPGLMCLMGQDRDRETPPLEIYGPEGLRMWLRVAIRYSVSRIVPPYRVHEIKNIPMAPEWRLAPYGGKYFNSLQRGPDCQWGEHGLAGEDPASWISKAKEIRLEPSDRFGEIPGGRDIYPEYNHPMAHDGAPVWEVEDEDDVKVYAAPMSHGIPCLGYVVKEQSRPGRLRSEYVEPIVRRNIQALKDAGFKIPMKALAVIKNLPEGSAFTFPDGTVVTQQDAVEPPRNGRKVVICGDTSDARAITKLAMDADVVVHEATNAFLDFLDKDSDNLHSITKDSMTHGHSTPQMAAIFAKNINAKRLLLNHFSPRYKGDQDIDSVSIMTRIEHQAMNTGDFDASQVAATWDFMLLPIPPN